MNKLALILAIIAGLVALSNFVYKLVRFHQTDYGILLVVIIVVILIASIYSRKGKKNLTPGGTPADNS
jgi:hypothetical protein